MLTIAYLGPEKTNTHFAAMKRFGKRARYLHAPTVDDVFHFVERRNADYGVVPVENSLEGAVTHTLDRFIDFVDTPVSIQGEVEQVIQHYLITAGRIKKLRDIIMVCSHPQALAQCRSWLSQHLGHAVLREMNSTAEALAFALEDPKARRAAIGRKELADQWKLSAMPISDQRENKTRFLILGHENPRKSARNKTSILFALKDRPGALHDSLMPFKRQGINLTKIESRPSKKKAWEYLFFIDVEGHITEPRVTRALKALERSTSLLRVLGSYPVASR